MKLQDRVLVLVTLGMLGGYAIGNLEKNWWMVLMAVVFSTSISTAAILWTREQ